MLSNQQNYRVPSAAPPISKRLGSYLEEAGLLSKDQITVILNDQRATGLRFGEIAVARGWLKEQTVEWVMSKVVMPERRVQQKTATRRIQPTEPASSPSPTNSPAPPAANLSPISRSQTGAFVRRDAPIAKPLPAVKSSDEDVNWVG